MSQPQCLKGKIRKEKFFLMLRQYQEEMLDAFLMEDEYFSELLHYCNLLYETLPMILNSSHLSDMDFDRYGKVKCRKIEGMLPKLMKMVEGEIESFS